MRRFITYTILSLVFCIHCTKNSLESALNPEIVSEPDHFEFKISDVRSITEQLQYQWRNTGINANIYNGSIITAGEAALVLTGAAGEEVFSGDLMQSGDFFSSAGEFGIWTVRLTLRNVSGTVHLRINRRL